jgi:Ser/Thr protein kinase RdoA (MazF antagonist)
VRQQAVWAAVVACVEHLGKAATKPEVLQDTNNVVVHLAPCPVVAKVGRFPWSAEALGKEVRVARHLADVGAPVAAPLTGLIIEPGTELPVSLWPRLATTAEPAEPAAIADALHQVHKGLASYPDPLPSFLAGLDLAGATLVHDDAMAAMTDDDRHLLRAAFATWRDEARALDPETFQRLHGEPHAFNVLNTADGPCFIDFEATCVGPIESDLACLDPEVFEALGVDHDPALLDLMVRLRSAVVAVWCWASEHPAMREHAEHHLGVVRARARRA